MEKVWDTFKEVSDEYSYVNERMVRAKDLALKYINAVVCRVHSIGLMLGDKPVLVTQNLNELVYFTKIGQHEPIEKLGIEGLYDLCSQIRQQHLVKEWGDPDFDEEEKEKEK